MGEGDDIRWRSWGSGRCVTDLERRVHRRAALDTARTAVPKEGTRAHSIGGGGAACEDFLRVPTANVLGVTCARCQSRRAGVGVVCAGPRRFSWATKLCKLCAAYLRALLSTNGGFRHPEVLAWVAVPAASSPSAGVQVATSLALPVPRRQGVVRVLCQAYVQEEAASLHCQRKRGEDIRGKAVPGTVGAAGDWRASRARWLARKLVPLAGRCHLCRRRCPAGRAVVGGEGRGQLLQSDLCVWHSWAAGLEIGRELTVAARGVAGQRQLQSGAGGSEVHGREEADRGSREGLCRWCRRQRQSHGIVCMPGVAEHDMGWNGTSMGWLAKGCRVCLSWVVRHGGVREDEHPTARPTARPANKQLDALVAQVRQRSTQEVTLTGWKEAGIRMLALGGRCTECSEKGSFVAPTPQASSASKVAGEGLMRQALGSRGRWGKLLVKVRDRSRGVDGACRDRGGRRQEGATSKEERWGIKRGRSALRPERAPPPALSRLGRGHDRNGMADREGMRLELRCARHQRRGDMLPLKHGRRCLVAGCAGPASFGAAAVGAAPEVCCKHRLPFHVDLVHRRCCQPGCGRVASFGVAGTGGRGKGRGSGGTLYCAAHKQPHHSLLYHATWCVPHTFAPSCTSAPKVYLRTHANTDMRIHIHTASMRGAAD